MLVSPIGREQNLNPPCQLDAAASARDDDDAQQRGLDRIREDLKELLRLLSLPRRIVCEFLPDDDVHRNCSGEKRLKVRAALDVIRKPEGKHPLRRHLLRSHP
jgi:hypothetical protein